MPRSIFNWPPFRRGGNPAGWNVPRAVQALPMTLLRSQLYPRDPALVAEGIHHYEEILAADLRPAHYLPGHMLYQQHKESPAPRGPLSPAEAAIAAQWPEAGARATAGQLAQMPSFARGQGSYATAQARGMVEMPTINEALDKTRMPLVAKTTPRHDRTDLPSQIADARSVQQELALALRAHQDAHRQMALEQSTAKAAALSGVVSFGATAIEQPYARYPMHMSARTRYMPGPYAMRRFGAVDDPFLGDPAPETTQPLVPPAVVAGVGIGMLLLIAAGIGGSMWLTYKVVKAIAKR